MSSGVPAQPRRRAARRAPHTQGASDAAAAPVERLADGAPVHARDALADLDGEARRRRACAPVSRDTHKTRPTPPHQRHRHTTRKTQVHAAFDVQDTEAWSNADDLRTPSEVKAELARLRQLALACVTAKMDNKKVNDKIDLNARARRPVVAIALPWEWFLFC